MPDRDTVTGDDRSRGSVFRWIGRWMGSDAGLAGPSAGPLTESAISAKPTARLTAEHTPRDAARVFPDIPGFDILDEAGRGGMGEVYVARDLGIDKVVALKLIDARGLDGPSLRARFEREVRAMSRIDHPNIVPVYHAAYAGGRAYFTMKYVPGGNLAKNMARVRADLRRAVRVVAVIARAVQHAHDRGILHRDLKPHNILLGDDDEPLVADFGLAKFAADGADDLTRTGAILGTRQYMSPEQTRGKTGAFTPACDIWALGVILYEVLSGRRPFADDDPVELYRQIREQEPDSCSSTNPDAPPELEAVVRTCLAKDPTARYETAGQVADALERWLADGSVPPKPPRSRRWPRRAAVAAVALALLTGAAAAWVGTRDEPPVPVSVADRLAAGEAVTLIGPDGPPADHYLILPGSRGVPATRPDGYFGLQTVGVLAVESFSGLLPRPVWIEAEVALATTADRNSNAGVYAGGGAADAARQQIVVLDQSEDALPDGPEREHLTETAAIVLFGWNSADGLGIDRLDIRPRRLTTTVAVPRRPDLRWHRVRLRLTPERISGEWDELTIAIPTDYAPVRQILPAPGPGVGLFADHVEAAFRNVRLVPE